MGGILGLGLLANILDPHMSQTCGIPTYGFSLPSSSEYEKLKK